MLRHEAPRTSVAFPSGRSEVFASSLVRGIFDGDPQGAPGWRVMFLIRPFGIGAR
jgi:hypothetical protein